MVVWSVLSVKDFIVALPELDPLVADHATPPESDPALQVVTPPLRQGATALWHDLSSARLQPAADARFVVAEGRAEMPFEIRLLARHDDSAHDDDEWHCENEHPRAARRDADAGVEQKHADIDRIAAP